MKLIWTMELIMEIIIFVLARRSHTIEFGIGKRGELVPIGVRNIF